MHGGFRKPRLVLRGYSGCDSLILSLVTPGLKVANNIRIKLNRLFEGVSYIPTYFHTSKGLRPIIKCSNSRKDEDF